MKYKDFQRAKYLENEIEHLKNEFTKLLNNDNDFKAIQIYLDNGTTIFLDDIFIKKIFGLISPKNDLLNIINERMRILEKEFYTLVPQD